DPRLLAKSPRVERLLAVVQRRMLARQRPWGEGLTVLDDATAAGQPLIVRRALATARLLGEMPIAIEDDDLIVGLTAHEGVIVRPRFPEFATAAERAAAKAEGHAIGHRMSHKTPNYRDAMTRGLGAILTEVDAKRAQIAARPAGAARDESLALFDAMAIELRAVIALARRYADLADTLAAQSPTAARALELRTIAAVCRRVPEHPPRTLHEALQALWFIHYAFFSANMVFPCGRLDQYLYPACAQELASGAITLERAQELVDCLWMRFNDRAQVERANFAPPEVDGDANGQRPTHPWPAGHRMRRILDTDQADAINHFGQNILLGGTRPDGGDGTNPLTYLCLNAQSKFSFTSPVLTVRLHKGSPPQLVRRAAEAIKADGGGMPYINNDDTLVAAYVALGVPVEDARDYANSNCWETLIQGKSDQELIRGMSFLLALELALGRGVSKVHGPMGPDTGDPREFAAFDDLMAAWAAQLDHMVHEGIDYIGEGVTSGTLEHSSHGVYCHFPLLSALTADCIARERDATKLGARYTLWHVMGEALGSAVDAAAAIKHLVYDTHTVSMGTLLAALDADWQGNEELRALAVNRAPKYANDHPTADGIGRRMMDCLVESARRHARRWYPTVLFPVSMGTFSWIASIGLEVGASADGRRAYEPVSANMAPTPGADRSGPIAAIQSALKMRPADLAAGAPLDLRLAKSLLQGDAGTDRLAALLTAFVGEGGNMLTLTVTDVAELRRAMAEPEKHRHLRVRMGGWSAYFVMLSKEQQLLHIRKVEHGLGLVRSSAVRRV
ncbi:MAG: pyruvate formate lyase family protein, partial [Chloroflexota bacterium]